MGPGLRQVFDDLVRFETILWGELDARLRKESGLTLGALNVRMVIQATPGCRVLDIAQALAITVGGVSQAVDRLEAAGHAARTANPADRRSSILELTARGQALLEQAYPVFDRELKRLLQDPLPAAALPPLAEALGLLRQAADPRNGKRD